MQTLLPSERVIDLRMVGFNAPQSVHVTRGGQALDVSVRGATVEVVPADLDAAVAADPLRLLDGLTGRVPLRDVIAAPDDVRAALGLLARGL